MPALFAEMRADLAAYPLRRGCILAKRCWVYNGADNYLFYYYDDHADLDDMMQVLENHVLVTRDYRWEDQRFIIQEPLADYLVGESQAGADSLVTAPDDTSVQPAEMSRLPRLLAGNPRNLLSTGARERLYRIQAKAEAVRRGAFAANPDDTDGAKKRIERASFKAARQNIAAVAKEFGALGMSDCDYREAMWGEIEAITNSWELNMLYRQSLQSEFFYQPELTSTHKRGSLSRKTAAAAAQSEVSGGQMESLRLRTDSESIVNDPEPSGSLHLFRREGGIWTLSFDGKTIHVKHIDGLEYLAELLRKPRCPVPAISLASAGTDLAKELPVAGIPSADAKAIREVRAAITEREVELVALSAKDWVRRGELEEQIRQLVAWRNNATNIKGRPRTARGSTERARINVTNAIHRAIKEIRKVHLGLAEHLSSTVKTGTETIYTGPDLPSWEF